MRSPRPRWKWLILTGMLFAGLARPAAGQFVAVCPQAYWFNVTYPFGLRSSGASRIWNFNFKLGTIETNIYPGWGRYRFANIPANEGGANLIGGWIDGSCTLALVPLPPYGTPQRVLFIVEIDHGGHLELTFTPPHEDDCSGGDGGDDWGDGGWEELRAAAESTRSSTARAPNGPLAGPHLAAAGIRTAPKVGGVAASANGCTGGGDSTTGGNSTTWYCLIIDWYDLSGNYLYSETIFCWEEE